MCGIVGVLGNHEVAPIIVEALKRLEYRGYDSAGIATINDEGRLDRRRAVGKLINLSDLLVHQPLPGKAATPAGPPMARRQRATPIPTAPAASASFITASSKISENCAKSLPNRVSASRPKPTPRRWRS
jgi:glucosamine--fructose-6-phosphate aminotransferase (isomerizing)